MLSITTPGDLTAFDPGSEIELYIGWEFENDPSSIEVRLVWSTSGKGDQDLKVVQKIVLESPPNREERPVLIALPWGPYSFSGKLISLVWGIELIAFPSKESIRKTIVIAPQGKEILLTAAT